MEYFFDWVTDFLPMWAIAVSFGLGLLISLPRTTLVVTFGALIAYLVWSSGLEDEIMDHLSNEGGGATKIGDLLDHLGLSVEDEAVCSFATCKAYDTINVLIADERLIIETETDSSKTAEQIVRLVREEN